MQRSRSKVLGQLSSHSKSGTSQSELYKEILSEERREREQGRERQRE